MNELMIALKESVKLQSHYAELLNMYDTGERMTFNSVEKWISRLRKVGILPPNQTLELTGKSSSVSKKAGIARRLYCRSSVQSL